MTKPVFLAEQVTVPGKAKATRISIPSAVLILKHLSRGKMRHTNTVLFFAAFLVLGTSALNANLVTNGNFENGSVSGWTSSQDWSALPSVYGISGPHSGQFFATTPCIGTSCAKTLNPTSFLFQALPTTIGQTYTLTFFLNAGIDPLERLGVIDGALLVTWDGNVAWGFIFGSPSVSYGWQAVTVPGLVATSTSTVLRFSGRQDDSFIGIDDIAVTASGATAPEPDTIVEVGSFLVGLAVFQFGADRVGVRVRRRRTSAA
jgi:hypothetical protein